MTEFALPPKLLPAFRRLHRHYDHIGKTVLRDLLASSRFHFELGVEYDNWDGGTHGHDVIMFVPGASIDIVGIDDQGRVSEQFCSDVNKVTPDVENEYVSAVYIKLEDDLDPQCQGAIPLQQHHDRPQDVGLWNESSLRLFLSHRVQYKAHAHALASALEPYGVSTFVAHDAIKPMKEWQKEILNGLKTMEVMLVLLTDDFHGSSWTDQEVGFALGTRTPIVCVKVGTGDPRGFIGSRQALTCSLDGIVEVVPKVYRALIEEIGQESRLKEILIDSFVSSSNYSDTISALKRLTEAVDHLNDQELGRIIEGYAQNDQLYGCVGIHTQGNSIIRFLEGATGRKLVLGDREIREQGASGQAGVIPF